MATLATLCPNLNSTAWKMLVEESNGSASKAYETWENNNQDYPQHILDKIAGYGQLDNNEESYNEDPYLLDKNRLLEKSKGVLKKKIKKLTYLVQSNPQFEEAKRELEQLVTDMDKLEVEYGLHRFILAADRMANSAYKWMADIKAGKKEATMENLKRMQEYVDSFSLLKDLKVEFFKDEEHKKDFQIISTILGKQNEIKSDYLTIARKKIADQFSPYFGKIEADYRRKAELEFNKTEKADLIKKGNKGKDLDKAKQNYIENYMMANAVKLKIETDEYVHKLLVQTVDISAVTNLLINPKDMNHDIMSMAVETLDKVDYDISQKTIKKTREAERIYQNFIKQVGKHSDPKDQYASILIQYIDEEDPDSTPQTANVIMNPEYFGWEEFKRKHEGDAVWEMQQFLMGIVEEKDLMVPIGQRLGFTLPRINKNSFERLASQGLFHTTKEGIIDKFRLRAEDTDFGDIDGRLEQLRTSDTIEVSTNEAGKEREHIPLYYRAQVDPKELSFDVLSSILLDYNNSLNYRAKSETGVFLEVLKEVVANVDINTRSDFKKLLHIDRETGQAEAGQKGISSNLYNAIEGLIRHRVYGIQVEGDPQVAKMIKTVGNYTSIVALAANHLSGAANLLHGTTVSWIEGFGNKNGAYSAKDRAKATIKYDKDLPNVMADVGQRVMKSKTNLLAEKFNAFSDFNTLDKKFVENNRGKRLFNTSSLMFFNNVGEHVIQSTVMYSILNNIKVQNSNGQYLNKNFEIVSSLEEAMSIDEAMYITPEGNLEVDSRVGKTNITNGVSEEDLFIISRKIRRINRDLFGNYDQQNKSKLKRHAIGALVMQMRGWLLPGIQKRWRSLGTFKTASQNLTIDQRSYNQETKQFEEGTYVTAIRFLYNLKGDIKTLKLAAVPENWHNLTDQEKSNIKKAGLEIGLAAVFLMVAMSLRDSDEPEDIYVAFLSRRLYSELTSFINPKEAVRTFRTPMISLSTVETALDFVIQLTSPFELYETGRDAGESKLKKRFLKLVPIWKQIDRSAEEALIFLER